MNPPSSKLSLIDSDLSKVPHLEVLHPGIPFSITYSTRLTRFESFCTLLSSNGCLSQLVRLNLFSCESLASLPDNIDELRSLKLLLSKLKSLSDNINELKFLKSLNLSGHSRLASLPDNIGALISFDQNDYVLFSFC